MARGVRLLGIELVLKFRHEGVLVEESIWTSTSILDLRQCADTVAGGCAFEQHLVDLGGVLLSDLHTEGLLELREDRSQTVDGIALGLFGAVSVLPHLLAPVISGHIVGEGRGVVFWRPGQELQHVGHVLCGEIGINSRVVLGTGCAQHQQAERQ